MAPKESRREPFEKLYARLEQEVEKLERGGLSLDEAIAVYESGMQLARQCQELLDEAELKITKLRESFADVPQRANGAVARDGGDALEDYEYVADEEFAESDEDAS